MAHIPTVNTFTTARYELTQEIGRIDRPEKRVEVLNDRSFDAVQNNDLVTLKTIVRTAEEEGFVVGWHRMFNVAHHMGHTAILDWLNDIAMEEVD
jgi:hypothetical protein